ncbi:MAG: nucleotidyl transferase AbiEii/AbiGii toxin family protein, partial [Muribaculaceae bacterium]|nr:nucleotidyl transferase AbiEii/AbiGii toxin family protein [Muribaculaceae bacterium]
PKDSAGLVINVDFIEKDYWITKALQQLSRCEAMETAVFKGGTSLSKIYRIGARFSEDVDVAIVKPEGMTDAKLKSIIRNTEKSMAEGMIPIDKPGLTSKGSRYRKSYYLYQQVEGISPISSLLPGQLLIEINSFANPYPFHLQPVSSFIRDYLVKMGHNEIIEDYDLDIFNVNVLDKRTTFTEKLVSLIRFSLSDNPTTEVAAKIRHFYDIHYLIQDGEIKDYINDGGFVLNFNSLLNHDRELFAKPDGWQNKQLNQSPLVTDLSEFWKTLSLRYEQELPPLAYSQIPTISEIENSISIVMENVRKLAL